MNPDWRLYTDKQRAHNLELVAAFRRAATTPAPEGSRIDPLLYQAMCASTGEFADMLQAQVDEYDAWQHSAATHQSTATTVTRVEDMGVALIRARKARGWTQRQLGEEIGVNAQQIQHYERTLYSGASVRRCQEVATVLEATVRITVAIEPTVV